MELRIKFELPKKQLLSKKNYEPLLLECLNHIPFFDEKSNGGFAAPQSESNGQCDAIGKNGCYSVDFKLLLSQEGAQNMNETSITKVALCKGVTMSAPSKASAHGIASLPFPNIWAFLRTQSLSLNESGEIALLNEADKNMGETIKSLNKMIHTKKNLIFFNPSRLFVFDTPDNPIEYFCSYAREVLSIISKARKMFSQEYETYYALLMNNKMVLLSEDFAHIGCIDLTTLDAWRKLHI